MSKLSLLKDVAEMKYLLNRRSSWTRAGIALGVVALLWNYGHEGFSYLSTASRMVKDKFRTTVPIDFELQRARTMLGDLLPGLRKNMIVIVQEEVGVDDLRKDVEKVQRELDTQREELLALRGDMENRSGSFRIGKRVASSDEVREEVARRFSRYQTAEATVDAKRQLLEARERSLTAARVKLERTLNLKRDLEVQVENLASRLRTQQSQVASGTVEFDDSQAARCKELVDDLRVRLEVADRLLASHGSIDAVTSSAEVAPAADIGDQIDKHFARLGNSSALADSRH